MQVLRKGDKVFALSGHNQKAVRSIIPSSHRLIPAVHKVNNVQYADSWMSVNGVD